MSCFITLWECSLFMEASDSAWGLGSLGFLRTKFWREWGLSGSLEQCWRTSCCRALPLVPEFRWCLCSGCCSQRVLLWLVPSVTQQLFVQSCPCWPQYCVPLLLVWQGFMPGQVHPWESTQSSAPHGRVFSFCVWGVALVLLLGPADSWGKEGLGVWLCPPFPFSRNSWGWNHQTSEISTLHLLLFTFLKFLENLVFSHVVECYSFWERPFFPKLEGIYAQ